MLPPASALRSTCGIRGAAGAGLAAHPARSGWRRAAGARRRSVRHDSWRQPLCLPLHSRTLAFGTCPFGWAGGMHPQLTWREAGRQPIQWAMCRMPGARNTCGRARDGGRTRHSRFSSCCHRERKGAGRLASLSVCPAVSTGLRRRCCQAARAAERTVLVAATMVLVKQAGMPRACGRKTHMPRGSTLWGSYPAGRGSTFVIWSAGQWLAGPALSWNRRLVRGMAAASDDLLQQEHICPAAAGGHTHQSQTGRQAP